MGAKGRPVDYRGSFGGSLVLCKERVDYPSLVILSPCSLEFSGVPVLLAMGCPLGVLEALTILRETLERAHARFHRGLFTHGVLTSAELAALRVSVTLAG